jgi:hypothetical protein
MVFRIDPSSKRWPRHVEVSLTQQAERREISINRGGFQIWITHTARSSMRRCSFFRPLPSDLARSALPPSPPGSRGFPSVAHAHRGSLPCHSTCGLTIAIEFNILHARIDQRHAGLEIRSLFRVHGCMAFGAAGCGSGLGHAVAVSAFPTVWDLLPSYALGSWSKRMVQFLALCFPLYNSGHSMM